MKYGAVELQYFDIAACADRSGSLAVIEERHLTEGVSGSQDIQRKFFAALTAFYYSRLTGTNDIEAVCLITLLNDIAAKAVRSRGEALYHDSSELRWKKLDHWQAGEHGGQLV